MVEKRKSTKVDFSGEEARLHMAPTPSTDFALSVVLPAYNEEAVIERTVRACIVVVSEFVPDLEVIVVDDGSHDQAGYIVDRLAIEDSQIRAIHNRPNRGYGGALIAGFQAVPKPLTFFMDADGQFDIREIVQLLEQRERGYRAVFGYRKLRQDAFIRLLNAKGWNFIVSWVLGLRIRDIDCAFKLYDTTLLHTFDVRSNGTKLAKLRIPYIEVPVSHYRRSHGKATGASIAVSPARFSSSCTSTENCGHGPPRSLQGSRSTRRAY
jgi:glycosyltransferase involved in cell wall biosynthesis